MPWAHGRSRNEDEPHVDYDDGGTGLYDACTQRFEGRGWTVECDASHAVWVRSTRTQYAVGIAKWMVDRKPVEVVVERVEAKMTRAEQQAATIGNRSDAQ